MVLEDSSCLMTVLAQLLEHLGEAPSHLDNLCTSCLGERRGSLWFLSELQQQ